MGSYRNLLGDISLFIKKAWHWLFPPKQAFIVTSTNAYDVFRQYLDGKITAEDFRRAKIVTKSYVIYVRFDPPNDLAA